MHLWKDNTTHMQQNWSQRSSSENSHAEREESIEDTLDRGQNGIQPPNPPLSAASSTALPYQGSPSFQEVALSLTIVFPRSVYMCI